MVARTTVRRGTVREPGTKQGKREKTKDNAVKKASDRILELYDLSLVMEARLRQSDGKTVMLPAHIARRMLPLIGFTTGYALGMADDERLP